MEISNKLGYLVIESEYTKKYINKEYESMTLTMDYLCSEIFSYPISMKEQDDCAVSGDNIYFDLDLSQIKNQNKSIVALEFKNLLTGEIVTKAVNISFADYKQQCPTGCTLQSIDPTYSSLFTTAIGDAMKLFKKEPQFTVAMCGDRLIVKIVDEGVIASGIKLSGDIFVPFTFAKSKNYIISGNLLIVSPTSVGLDTFKDGVYGLKVKYYDAINSWIEEQNCYFNDVTIKCKVAKYMKELLGGQAKASKDLHYLHYALTNASNCGDCGCENMCNMYNKIEGILISNPTITQEKDCSGCK